VYAERRRRLQDVLVEEFGAHLDLLPSAGGLHFAATLRHEGDDNAIARRARSRGLALEPLSSYLRSPGPSGLAIGYGAIPSRHIVEGMRQLLDCLE
jgi:GntR family transcriptional regulator/MocR family aminotransferase